MGAGEVVRRRRVVERRPRRRAPRCSCAAPAARGFESPLTRLAQLPALVAPSPRREHARRQRAQHPRALRSRQRVLPAVPRSRDARRTRAAIFAAARATLAAAQRAKLERLCELLALVAARSPARDRLRLGRHGDPRRAHARLPRHRDHRVARAARARDRARRRRRASPIASRSSIATTASSPARSTKIVSIEMLEAVGYEYLPALLRDAARACSRPAAGSRCRRSRCPTIGSTRIAAASTGCRPTSSPARCIPSLARDPRRAPRRRARDRRAPTTSAPTTRRRCARGASGSSPQLPAVRALGFDEPFIRTWLLYLAFSEAAFAERTLGDHQLVLSALLSCASTVTVVVMPPRTQNLPVTVIERGEIAATRSSQIWLVTASWNAPSLR